MGNVRDLIFCNFVVCKEIQWFWSINFNALFSRNIVSGEVKRWSEYIKYDKKGNGAAYNNVVLYNNKIIAIPGRERKILILDTETECFRYIDLEMPFIREYDNAFFAYVVSDNYLFMIGNEIPYVLKLDMESEKILKCVKLEIYIADPEVYFRDAVLDNDKLLVPLIDENIVYEIDTDTLRWRKRKVGGSKDGFSAICRSEENIWLMPRQQRTVLQWHRENNEVIIHEIEKEGIRYNRFHSGHFIGKRIWVFPVQGNMVFSFDAETGELMKENAINSYIETSQSEECVFRAVQVEREHIFLLCFCMNEWLQMIYDTKRDKLEISKLKCEISYEELYNVGIDTVNEMDFELEKFINYIAINNRNGHGFKNYNQGNQIWEMINCVR